MIMTAQVLKKYPLWFEIVSGIIFGALNIVCSTFFGKIGCPFFMDTIFSVTAAFTGLWSGILSVASFILLSALQHIDGFRLVHCLFGLSVLEMVFIVRLVFRKKDKVTFLSLLYVYALCVIFISVTGGIITAISVDEFAYTGYFSIRYITMTFTKQHFPLVLSATVSRILVNAVDKLIAVFAGFGLYVLIEKIWRRQ